ncbi:M3 family oligoendopeptidase [Candidatus Nitrospira nitrificans]|uniref:Putative Oligoendopeptidase F n=1 Tax=Candidatus Nitrospira nitrificans TaxID=1742973 RepID=A0A0S4LTR7_9BACT|nr:M3 family oligoendopeptidase [Candidatus Nitrospira nitrificans]CUS39928.1 putative Oligoendopeptidase F [Candidatus Nitrospira nitrificans]
MAVRHPVPRKTSTSLLSDRWDLTHLVKDPLKNLKRHLAALDAQVMRIESARPRLQATMASADFHSILKLTESIAEGSARLGAFAYLWFSENTTNTHARSFKSQVEERLAGITNRLLFLDLWWQGVDQKNAARMMADAGDLRYYLETIRRYTPHTLSEPEEKIINVKNVTGRSAVNTLYDVVTNGLTFTMKVGGKTRTMNREELMSHVRSPKASIRQAAYRELYRVFLGQRDLLGEMYRTLVNDWKAENVELRRFASPIATRNLGNDVPDRAVDVLLATCAKNVEIFQTYFKLKAKICKISPMNRYHIYAPHRAETKKYKYADAVRMVLDAYRGFSPQLADLAEQVLRERHVDGPTRPGKLGGAYCYSVAPGLTPYVMLNFTGEARDIATMAHELGHAAHGMMAEDHSIFTFHSTLPLAETASVFGERILSDTLLSNERNKSVRQGLLVSQLDDIYATVLRQAYFIHFEQTAHRMVAEGATGDHLAEAYLVELRQQFGKAVTVPDEFQWEWLMIPHLFASPFYCYAYSFGNLLVLALYRMYKEQGSSFVPKYLDLLATGGSQSPQDILSKLDVDMTSAAFWQSGFDTIQDMVQQLEGTM